MITLIECSIDFFNENEVAVSVNASNEYTADFLATLLFSSYTFRQAINIGINHPVVASLGKGLSVIPYSDKPVKFAVIPTNAPITGSDSVLRYISIQDINFVPSGKLGKKRFFSKLVLQNGITRLLLEAKGFGIMGAGITYYAPTSVLVLFAYLANQIADFKKFGAAAMLCGEAITSKELTLENQLHYAHEITKALFKNK